MKNDTLPFIVESSLRKNFDFIWFSFLTFKLEIYIIHELPLPCFKVLAAL